MENPKGKLTAQPNPNLRIQEEIQPIKITKLPDGKFILDMGQNMVGWVRINNLNGKKDQPITLRFAELLNPDSTLYMDNLRSAKVTDIYIPAKDGTFSWEPSFVYHGFRYVEVSGLDYQPNLSNFTGRVLYDKMATTGQFETSNEIINRVFKNAYWGIRGNYRGMPTDCPQRDERQGGLVIGQPDVLEKLSSLIMHCCMVSGCKISKIRKVPKVVFLWFPHAIGQFTTTM
jgi:alpha-L-rhamnosidase